MRLSDFLTLVLALVMAVPAWSRSTAFAFRTGDTLTIGNSAIERKFIWNGGNLMTFSLTDKVSGKVHYSRSLAPDFVMTSQTGAGKDGEFSVEEVPQTRIHPAYTKAVVTYVMDDLRIRREFRIYEGVPAIVCDTWMRGGLYGMQQDADVANADRKNIESSADMVSRPVTAVLDRVSLEG